MNSLTELENISELKMMLKRTNSIDGLCAEIATEKAGNNRKTFINEMSVRLWKLQEKQTIIAENKIEKIWGIDVNKLFEKTRKREIVEVRQIMMKYRFEKLRMGWSESTERYNQRHAALFHARKKVSEYNETDPQYRDKFSEFKQSVGW
jgi:ATPase involved in DNA replication initiation